MVLNLGLFNVLIYVKEENPYCVITHLLEPQILYFKKLFYVVFSKEKL